MSELREMLGAMVPGEVMFVENARMDERGVLAFDLGLHRIGRGTFWNTCICGKQFEGKLERATFCSSACRTRAHRAAKKETL